MIKSHLNSISKINSKVSDNIFISLLVLTCLLFSNGLYLKIFSPFLYPNDRLSLVGSFFLIALLLYLYLKYPSAIFQIFKSRYGKMILIFYILTFFPTIVFGYFIEQRQTLIRPNFVLIRLYSGLLFFYILNIYCKSDHTFILLHDFILTVGISWILFLLFAYFFPELCSSIINDSGRELTIRLDQYRFKPPAGIRIAIVYTCFFGIFNFLNKFQKYRVFWLLISFITLFDFIYVTMMRRYIVTIILTPVVYFFFKFNLFKKYGLIILITVIIFSTYYLTPNVWNKFQWIYDSISTESTSRSLTSSNARIHAFKFYYPELVKTKFLGYGYYSPDHISKMSKLAHGNKLGYYEGDLGIVMPFLMYGIQALLWTFAMYYFLLKDLYDSHFNNIKLKIIRNTLFLTILWSILSLHTFVWGYHEPYWWSIIIFMVSYIGFKGKPVNTNIK